jgi:N-acyl-D-amino-acid deacylase
MMQPENERAINSKKPGYTLLKDGLIVDGTGKQGYQGHLLIKGTKIEEISRQPISIDGEILDCSGLVIAPGFIDVHSHMDWILSLEGFERLKTPFTSQGCTTMVTGNCGYSPGGFRPNSAYKKMIRLGSDRGFEITWDTMEDYFNYLGRVGLSHNVVHLAGHGTTQISMRGLNPSPLDREEMRELLSLLEEAMDQGAAGISFGLGYEPGMFFTKDEIMEVARLVRKKDKIVTVHGRAYSLLSAFYPLDGTTPHNVLSLNEMIDVARETGVRLQYSHLMFAGSKTHPTYKQCLEVLEQAISEGIDIMTDTYPYHCGNSVINVVLPPWFLADIPANYSNSQALARVEKGLDNMSRHVGFGYEDIQLTYADHPDFNPYNGMFIDEIAEKLGMNPSRVIIELSEKTRGRARILNHNYSNMEIIDALIAHPACLFMTDSVVSAEGVQNPASYGTFPLLLQYARDRDLISLEEAVRKMTGASADRLNLKDRGLLKKGLAADITVFDWKNIRDNNTVKETDKEPAGIEAVFINGRQVKKKGRVDASALAGVVVGR